MPRRHPSSSPLLSPPVLIILLPIITFLFLFYTIPLFISLTSQILRPTISVKKSWDSLNVFLVIFAILCGIFAKRNDGGSPTEEDHHHIANSDPLNISTNNTTNASEPDSVLPQQWYGFSETMSRTPEAGGGRLRRSSSSYPDLRQLSQGSLWEARDHNKSQFRFFDDLEINPTYHRTPPVSHQSRSDEYSDVIKEIPVDTFVVHSSPPPKSPEPPPPPPQPPTAPRQPKPRRTYQSVGRKDQKKEKVVNKNIVNEAEELDKVRTPPQTPPPPPPPRPVAPPSPMRVRSDHKRRKSNVKKEIAMVWASVVSNQRKRKKQKATTTRNIYDTATHSPPEPQQQEGGEGHYYSTRPPPSPPPPPPPPPPYSVFHNLFKKGIMSKTKKVYSVSTPPAPPPPPPRSTLPKHRSWSTNFPSEPPTPPPQQPPVAPRRRSSAASGRPPLPTKANSYLYEENVNSGCQSPSIPVAPPPPPFKMPELKFFVRGDFVKIRSAESSRCGSPELEDVDALPGKEEESESQSPSQSQSAVNATDGGHGGGGPSVFCPSPDVNTKADNFIARRRDEWRLEKMNSLRERKKMT